MRLVSALVFFAITLYVVVLGVLGEQSDWRIGFFIGIVVGVVWARAWTVYRRARIGENVWYGTNKEN